MKQLLVNIAFFGLVLLATAAHGQYTSQKGWFTVDEIKGCTGLTVNISFVPGDAPCVCGDSGCPCDLFINNEKKEMTSLAYTFTEPGSYTLEILFPSPNGSDYINVEIADNKAPEFSIYSCSNETILIDITDSSFDNYVIDYGDGTSQTVTGNAADPQHSYPDNSPRTIEIRGLNNSAADNCATGANTVVPLVSIPAPAITSLTMLDINSIVLNYNLAPDIYYELQISPSNSGVYSFIKFLDGDQTVDTIRSLSLSDNFVCFRITAKDPCNNTVAAYSNTICSIDLDLTVESDVNELSWKTADPDVNFSLMRDDLLTRPIGAALRSYNDIDINCGTDYCYTIVANYANGYTSTSLPQCGTAFSTTPPAPINNISTVVNGSTINISWEEPPNVTEYQLRKIAPASSFIVSEINNYLDSGLATTNQSYCYEISATDACGNKTLKTGTACSILLTGAVSRNNTVQLSWNDYTGWQNGVAEYQIAKSYSSGAATSSSTNTNSFTETDDNDTEQIIQYTITAIPIDGGIQASVSNTITIIKPVNIHYPDAFTPDGNSLNDEFKINGNFITSYRLRIYNRWGELIFISEQMDEGWTGTSNGKPLPQGTYAFTADLVDMAGRKHSRTGTIHLLRR